MIRSADVAVRPWGRRDSAVSMRSPYIKALKIGLRGVIGAGSIWTGTQYRNDIRHARAKVVSGSQTIATHCGEIEYATAGDGPAVLMVHGAGGGFDQGMILASSFVPRGYRVIAMSRFGYLRTPAPEHASILLQADAHACLLDALGVGRAVVVGVSAGAPSALEFALSHPERCTALVLVVPGWFAFPERVPRRFGPLGGIVFEWGLHSDFAFWVISRFFPAFAMRTVLGTPSNVVAAASATEQARVDSMLLSILPISQRISQRSAGLSLEASLTVERLSKPLTSLVGYPIGGHLLVGHADEVRAAVAHFLEETDAEPGR